LMTTSMVESGQAVHSRNFIFMGKDLDSAAQYYGTCLKM